jgi:RNA polymerase sigma factor (sigma-70 family)
LQKNLQPEEVNQLFINVKRGKHQVFTHLFNSHFRSLFYYAYQIISNKQQCEDIVNDVFMALLERFNDFDSLEAMEVFLNNEVTAGCLHYQENEKEKPLSINELQEQSLVNNDYSYETRMESTVIKAIYSEMNKLPAQRKEIIRRIFFLGQTIRQVAGCLKLKRQIVLNDKVRALKTIRVILLKNKTSPLR